MIEQAESASVSGGGVSARERLGWGLSEAMFLCVVVIALGAVVWCGRFAYREASMLEAAKANGEALARWASAVAESHGKGEYLTGPDCTSASPVADVPPTWQACREALKRAGQPLADMSNPFGTSLASLGVKCEKKSASTRGQVILEKGTPPPPGMNGSMTWGPLEDKDLIAKGLVLRVQVCDAGGYTVSVGEVTL